MFWLPTTELYSDAELPSHPCLKLLYNTEQYITIRLRRRLLTFEKIKLFEVFLVCLLGSAVCHC